MEDRRSIIRMTVKVQPPTPKPKQPPPDQTPPYAVEEISLKFIAVVECRHFLLSNSTRTATLTRRHKSGKVPLAVHQVPIQTLNHGPQALHHWLSSKFPAFQNDTVLSLHTITDKIIAKWAEIKQNLSLFVGEVLPLTVTLNLWSVVLTQTPVEGRFMVPTSDFSVEEMLERVKIEEQSDDHQIGSCVICLEDINGNMEKEESSEDVILSLLKLPCLHVFHEECIKEWLKSSHYCPLCRFQMPTNSS